MPSIKIPIWFVTVLIVLTCTPANAKNTQVSCVALLFCCCLHLFLHSFHLLTVHLMMLYCFTQNEIFSLCFFHVGCILLLLAVVFADVDIICAWMCSFLPVATVT